MMGMGTRLSSKGSLGSAGSASDAALFRIEFCRETVGKSRFFPTYVGKFAVRTYLLTIDPARPQWCMCDSSTTVRKADVLLAQVGVGASASSARASRTPRGTSAALTIISAAGIGPSDIAGQALCS